MPAVVGSAAGALFFDELGRVLLVEPTYKPRWDIPGGVIESGETPSAACAREVAEELGLTVHVGRLLVVDWAPHPDGDEVRFVFDGGLLGAESVAAIRLQVDELASFAFVPPGEVGEWLPPRLVRRVTAAVAARADGTIRYLEHAEPLR
ncbi:NUDIX domain-containing protein [Actinophytocola sp.]|uniref:NUDIX domain-containing protein n=1 Tax=Actinophytocola sp. TaxID=1872138 RepID=UPI003D6A7F1D